MYVHEAVTPPLSTPSLVYQNAVRTGHLSVPALHAPCGRQVGPGVELVSACFRKPDAIAPSQSLFCHQWSLHVCVQVTTCLMWTHRRRFLISPSQALAPVGVGYRQRRRHSLRRHVRHGSQRHTLRFLRNRHYRDYGALTIGWGAPMTYSDTLARARLPHPFSKFDRLFSLSHPGRRWKRHSRHHLL